MEGGRRLFLAFMYYRCLSAQARIMRKEARKTFLELTAGLFLESLGLLRQFTFFTPPFRVFWLVGWLFGWLVGSFLLISKRKKVEYVYLMLSKSFKNAT